MLTYIIHNIENTARRERLMKELEVQTQHCEEMLDAEIVKAIMVPKFPQRGISQSHKMCVQKAKDAGAKEVCILEDDVWFVCDKSFKRFLTEYENMPADGDLFFAGCYDGVFQPITDTLAHATEKLSGLHCYIVKEKFYDKFLSADETYNLDFWLTVPNFGNAKSYCTYPFVALQHDGYSDNTKTVTKYNQHIGRRFKVWNCQF